MNTTQILSRLEKVDLRTVWKNEASNFTPWLAEEANLKLLGDTIGIELELEAQEQSVGSFWADIVCKDPATDQRVLIENQLERTDHSHLGQLMTYAAGLDANTVVWIAARFTEEHRAAMDWLNHISGEDFNFFGLEVELWRIGDSAIAPKFNLTCKPNDWSKSLARKTQESQSAELTETKKLQLEFWTAFREYTQDRETPIKPTKAYPQHWMNLSIGRSGAHLSAIASLWDSASNSYETNEIRVEASFTDKNAKVFFQQLESDKPAIEQELGSILTWHNPEEARACRAYIRRDANLSNRDQWPDYHQWLLENLERFRSVFGPRVKNLATAEELGGEEAGIMGDL